MYLRCNKVCCILVLSSFSEVTYTLTHNVWWHWALSCGHQPTNKALKQKFFQIKMAPQKNEKKKSDLYVKETLLFKHCKKGAVPSNFTSLSSCERNFGFKYHEIFIFFLFSPLFSFLSALLLFSQKGLS